MTYFDYLRIALISVKQNVIRSFLTMLGIIISIASIIAVICIGEGGTQRIEKEMELVGTERIWVYAEGSTVLNSDDEYYIRQAIDKEIVAISPRNVRILEVGNADNNEVCASEVHGVRSEYFEIERMELSQGRPLLESRPWEAVITLSMAKKLFDEENVLGKTITIRNKSFTICGIIDDKKLTTSSLNPYRCIIDVEALADLANVVGYEEYVVRVKNMDLDEAGELACSAIIDATGKQGIKAYNMHAEIEMVNQVLETLKVILLCIGLICLLCGGIGIMNVMLISVKEKTREIGISKAIGAEDGQILLRFLTEALIYSLLGGFMGIPLGVAGSYVAAEYVNIPFVIPFKSIVIALLFSCGAGLFFGIYPAIRASRLKPIEALNA